MSYTYSITIESIDGLPVIEEDVQVALGKCGYEWNSEDNLWQTDDDHFTVDTETPLDLVALITELEQLDGVSSCKARAELIVTSPQAR